jgi:hypothetical protein
MGSRKPVLSSPSRFELRDGSVDQHASGLPCPEVPPCLYVGRNALLSCRGTIKSSSRSVRLHFAVWPEKLTWVGAM